MVMTSCSPSMGTIFPVNCSVQNNKLPPADFRNIGNFKSTLSSAIMKQPLLRRMQQAPAKMLDAFVDSVFEFTDLPLLPSQKNFAPVDELVGQGVVLSSCSIIGKIPDNFPEGVYVRNGPNPLFGGLKSTKSVFGRSSNIWIEGEGMLHALYFSKNKVVGGDGIQRWTVLYNNRYVETETYMLEKQRNKPSFLPAIGGDSLAVLSAYFLNLLRFGIVYKYYSNTGVFEHAGKIYSTAENYIPQEIDLLTLETLGNWDVSGAWNGNFTSHPKRAPGTGELVMMGVNAVKRLWQVGVVSADGKELIHKMDIKLNRCSQCHEMGVTQRYNVIMDFALTIDIQRLVLGGPLVKYNEEGYARIGIMPRYGDASSVRWFRVEPNCTFHMINCFEDADEVVLWGCKALDSIIGPSDEDVSKLFTRAYEWRLNLETGEVKEKYLTGKKIPMDFPIINGNFCGLKSKFAYTQLADISISGSLRFGGIAKLHFDEPQTRESKIKEDIIKVETHTFEEKTFCSGVAFVPKQCAECGMSSKTLDEDDGWVITFVHNEETNISKVYVIDTKSFTSKPVAEIILPYRVPYGFHGAFMPTSSHV